MPAQVRARLHEPVRVNRADRQHGPADRQRIFSTALADGLTAKDVHRRFGVNPHTHDVWRQKHGLRGRRPSRAADVM